MDKTQAWLTLHLTPGLGAAACKKLVSHFGGPEEIFLADKRELLQVKGIGEKTVSALLQEAPSTAIVEKELENAWKNEVSLVTWDSINYPRQLREIHNPPVILYVKGKTDPLGNICIAVVGSRAATSYGKKTAENIAAALASSGITVISGLALGVDSAAHRGALSAKGKTVAVLGCGVDVVYPHENKKLSEEITACGAVISEYPIGTQPEHFRFPARNRIISGLSHGVVVIEAAQRSGSLITAEMALEQGREIFAVPGRIDSIKSAGCHRILQEGAKLVHSVDDILNELPGHLYREKNALSEHNECLPCDLQMEEEQVFGCLEVYPKNIDHVITETGLPAQTVAQALLHLELKGFIEALPGRQYQKTQTLLV